MVRLAIGNSRCPVTSSKGGGAWDLRRIEKRLLALLFVCLVQNTVDYWKFHHRLPVRMSLVSIAAVTCHDVNYGGHI
jgi:hypothetical protein